MKFIFLITIFISSITRASSVAGPHIVTLTSDSILHSLDEQLYFKTSQLMYVLAEEADPVTRNEFWIYNNKKQKIYLTSAFNIKELDQDILLLPHDTGIRPYALRKTLEKDNDDGMLFSTDFCFHLEQFAIGSLNTIYQLQSNTASSYRYEIRSTFITKKRIHYGFNINFQNISWLGVNEQIRLSSLSLGPSLSIKILKNNLLGLTFLTSAELSPISQAKSSTYTDNYYGYTFDTGIEADFLNSFGTFTLGSHFRYHTLLLKGTTRPGILSMNREYNLSSIGLSLGYKMDWEL